MSSGKRTVQTDALDTLGTIISEKEKRDAIHLAVIPAKAGQNLDAGESVKIVDGVAVKDPHCTIGIVDPFLHVVVKKDQWFWLVINPRQITSLRHVWSHPAFDEEIQTQKTSTTKIEKSTEWIKNFSEKIGITYSRLMAAADRWNEREDYTHMGENDTYGSYWNEFETFWKHWEIVTGKEAQHTGSFFSCSC